MADDDDIDTRWSSFGELLVWIVFFFWTVWLFNAFVPSKSDQTSFDSYISQLGGSPKQGAAGAPSQRPDMQDPSDPRWGPPGGWR
jgi:hypothetical protein